MRGASTVVVLVTGLLTCLACSSGGGGGGSGTVHFANPCATKGATYLESFAEQSGGTCGALSSQAININSDGTVTTSVQITCTKVTVNGCTTQATDCTFSSMGYDYSETFGVTFTSDGSSGTGLVTLTSSGSGQSCTSTYKVSFVRQ